MTSHDLPPTRYLVIEVLAARYRLGELVWTFPTSIRPALRDLETDGLVWWKPGVIEGTCLAGLTEEGLTVALSGSYRGGYSD